MFWMSDGAIGSATHSQVGSGGEEAESKTSDDRQAEHDLFLDDRSAQCDNIQIYDSM